MTAVQEANILRFSQKFIKKNLGRYFLKPPESTELCHKWTANDPNRSNTNSK